MFVSLELEENQIIEDGVLEAVGSSRIGDLA